jgi:probable rRNA maturation factor
MTAEPTEPTEPTELTVQYALDDPELPTEQDFRNWAACALQGRGEATELLIRVVDAAEIRDLNGRYRGRYEPTNVLSFVFQPPPGVESRHLGDLVICAPVVKREAQEQHKRVVDHWAHMVVHGVLHLCGYDHQDEQEAEKMEALERRILYGIGIADPYHPRGAHSPQGKP